MKARNTLAISACLTLAAALPLMACSQKSSQYNQKSSSSASHTPGGKGGLQLDMPVSQGAATYDTLQVVINGQPCATAATSTAPAASTDPAASTATVATTTTATAPAATTSTDPAATTTTTAATSTDGGTAAVATTSAMSLDETTTTVTASDTAVATTTPATVSTATATTPVTTAAPATTTTVDPCAAYTYQHNYAYAANRVINIGGLSGAVSIQATLLLAGKAIQTGTGTTQIIAGQTVPLTIQLTADNTGTNNTGSVQVQILEAGAPTPQVPAITWGDDPAACAANPAGCPSPGGSVTPSLPPVGGPLPTPPPTSGAPGVLPPPPAVTGTATTASGPSTTPAATGAPIPADDICSHGISDSWTASTGQPAFTCVLNAPGGATYHERVPSAALGSEAVMAEFCSQPGNHLSAAVFATAFGCVADGIF